MLMLYLNKAYFTLSARLFCGLFSKTSVCIYRYEQIHRTLQLNARGMYHELCSVGVLEIYNESNRYMTLVIGLKRHIEILFSFIFSSFTYQAKSRRISGLTFWLYMSGQLVRVHCSIVFYFSLGMLFLNNPFYLYRNIFPFLLLECVETYNLSIMIM